MVVTGNLWWYVTAIGTGVVIAVKTAFVDFFFRTDFSCCEIGQNEALPGDCGNRTGETIDR